MCLQLGISRLVQHGESDKELIMNCQVCGCAACYHNDCCDHKNPMPIDDSMDYMEWYDEYMTGADLPSYEKIKKKEKPQ